VLTCAFLAACFLAADADRGGDEALATDIGFKALVCGMVTGAVALAAAITLELDADSLADGLHGRGLPLIIVSAVAGAVSLWLLHRSRWSSARVTAVIAVGAIVAGWGIGQYPDLLVDSITIDDAAGARSTLIGLVIVFGLAAITAVPSLLWLYVLVNRPAWSEPHASLPESGDVA
jgi:cytochrome d ubiquinol oxidase subunit II